MDQQQSNIVVAQPQKISIVERTLGWATKPGSSAGMVQFGRNWIILIAKDIRTVPMYRLALQARMIGVGRDEMNSQ